MQNTRNPFTSIHTGQSSVHEAFIQPGGHSVSSRKDGIKLLNEQASNDGKSVPVRRNILSIDGGGVRCVVTMELLCALELGLTKLYGHPITLSEHFDMVVGTSAGGMLAAGIASGIPMTDIRKFVMHSVKAMFTPKPWYQRHRALYCKKHLRQGLIDQLGYETTLGDSKLTTQLLLPMRNWIANGY